MSWLGLGVYTYIYITERRLTELDSGSLNQKSIFRTRFWFILFL